MRLIYMVREHQSHTEWLAKSLNDQVRISKSCADLITHVMQFVLGHNCEPELHQELSGLLLKTVGVQYSMWVLIYKCASTGLIRYFQGTCLSLSWCGCVCTHVHTVTDPKMPPQEIHLWISAHDLLGSGGLSECDQGSWNEISRIISVQFSSVHSLSHVRLFSAPWTTEHQASLPSPTPGIYPNSCPLSQWCNPTISSSVVPFSSCLQSFPASGSFQMRQLFTSGGQSIGVSASTPRLPMNTQDWSPLGWTGWISLQSKGLSRVFSNTTVQKHQFFNTQLSL